MARDVVRLRLPCVIVRPGRHVAGDVGAYAVPVAIGGPRGYISTVSQSYIYPSGPPDDPGRDRHLGTWVDTKRLVDAYGDGMVDPDIAQLAGATFVEHEGQFVVIERKFPDVMATVGLVAAAGGSKSKAAAGLAGALLIAGGLKLGGVFDP